MAIAHVSRSTPAGSSASAGTVVSTATSHTSGNTLVALISCHGSHVTGITDTAGNFYQRAGLAGTDGTNVFEIWYAFTIVGNAANQLTATFNAPNVYRVIVVHELSGYPAGVDPFATGSQVSASGSGTVIGSGTVNFTGTSACILSLVVTSADSITSGSPSYGFSPFNASGDPANYFADGFRIVSASEAVPAGCASGTWGIVAAAFQLLPAVPPLTYAQFIAQPTQPFNLLAEISGLSQTMNGWTSVGSGTYSTPFDDYSHPITIRSDHGRYRGLDAVETQLSAGGVLTVRASIAAVQAAPGSYFFDSAAKLLYVQLSTSVNPDLTTVLAFFTLRTSELPANFVGGNAYAPLLDGTNLPTLHAEQQDFTTGLTVSPSGSLSFINADGFFEYPAAAWNWINATVTLKLGGGALAYSDYATLLTMYATAPPSCGDETASLPLRAMADALGVALPVNTWATGSTWPTGPLDASGNQIGSGQYMPLLFGYGFDLPAYCVAAGAGAGGWDLFIVVDTNTAPVVGSLVVTTVYATDQSGVQHALPTTDWTTASTPQLSINTGTWPRSTYTFSCDAHLTDFTHGNVDLWATPGDAIVGLLTGHGTTYGGGAGFFGAGLPSSVVDVAAFAAMDVLAPQKRGLYIAGGAAPDCFVSVRDALNRLRTFEIVQTSQTGKWTGVEWDPSFDLANTPIMPDRDILAWSPVETPTQKIASSATVAYAKRQRSGTSSTTQASSAEADLITNAGDLGAIDSPYVTPYDAQVHAQRLLQLAKQAPVEVEVTLGPAYLTAQIGDKYRIQRQRGTSAGVPPFDQVYEVIAYDKDLAALTATLTMSNMRGLGESVRRVAPNGTPNWASASADQRRQYLFVADPTTRRADPSDPASFRPGIVW